MATSSNSAHGECSSFAVVRQEVQPAQAQTEESLPNITPHDIFLSHSGVQKGFMKGLYKMLSPFYSTFFDITHHSLPLAENFPTHIFYAAKRCKLAIMVLSEEYVCSKWPMLELCAFVEAMPSVKILALFYSLSPSDIKDTTKLVRWREKWQTFAAQDSRIDVSVWDHALRKVSSNNGLVFDPLEGEVVFSDRIVSWIWESVPPTIKCNDAGIFGKDRLCKVILNKFKEMESQGQHLEHDDNLPKPCVLGMYGFPGSGKSTLSKFLYQHFFPLYSGKAHSLQLPTNPSLIDLSNIFKDLLKLTDFRQRINLDNVSDLGMVYSLLERHNLQKLRVFLVVDNISDKSAKAVKEFLKLGVGSGSKVLLIARTQDVLQPALLLGKEGKRFISDSICVPRISESEAAGILLHTLGVESTVIPSRSLVDVVRMCGFGSHQDDLLYLPLVMETMGSLLMRYEGDVKKWGNVLGRFRKKMKIYKEGAVKELINSSFKELGDEELQLLFLDVTLFIVPLELGSVREACDLLSVLHACSPERMETKIKDLQRHCFLRIDDDCHKITVHDVYVEFAETIQEDPDFRVPSSCRRWCWMQYRPTGAEMGREILLLRREHTTSDDQHVRTMIVENVEGRCERVELNGFVGLKALVVRNCKSLAVLALAGLTSLVSIDIQNCPCMQRLDSTDCDYSRVERFRVQGKEKEKNTASTLQVQQWWQRPVIHSSIVGLERVIAAITGWQSAPLRFFEGIAAQMRGLQVLRLEHTGIRRLVDMSSCWPQLRELYVEEYHLEAFEIGSLQRLNLFHFSDCKLANDIFEEKQSAQHQECLLLCEADLSWTVECKNQRRDLKGNWDLMKECPELEEVIIQSAFFEERHVSTLAPKVRSLDIQMHFALKLPDLTPSAPSLEELTVALCAKLERVDFFVKFERLKNLELSRCSSLVEVTGLGFLHNLHSLEVCGCPKLQVLGSFNNLRMLKYLLVRVCSELREISDLSGLISLESLEVLECPELQEIPSCSKSIRLTKVGVYSCQKLHKIHDMSGLASLKSLAVRNCPELREIPSLMGRLTSLVALELSHCPNIKTVSATKKLLFPLYCNSQKQEYCSLRNVQDSEELIGTFSSTQFGGNMFDATMANSKLQELNMSGEPAAASQSNHDDGASIINTAESTLREPSLMTAVKLSHGEGTLQLQSNLSTLLGGTLCSFRSIRRLKLGHFSDLVTLEGIEQACCTLRLLDLEGLPELRNVQGLESLINLVTLRLEDCPQLEELPSLHGLVKLRELTVKDCGKLRAVEGCDEMRSLGTVRLEGCRSLACFVFRDLDTFLRSWSLGGREGPSRFLGLKIEGCKFASIEAMVEWACGANVPEPLRRASHFGLEWEYTKNDRKLEVVEAFFPRLLSKTLLYEDDCFDYEAFFPKFRNVQQSYIKSVVGRLWSMFGSVPKKALLLRFHMDIEFRLSILHVLDIKEHYINYIFKVENWRSTHGI